MEATNCGAVSSQAASDASIRRARGSATVRRESLHSTPPSDRCQRQAGKGPLFARGISLGLGVANRIDAAHESRRTHFQSGLWSLAETERIKRLIPVAEPPGCSLDRELEQFYCLVFGALPPLAYVGSVADSVTRRKGVATEDDRYEGERRRSGYAAATPVLCSSLMPASRSFNQAKKSSWLFKLNTLTS